MFIDDKTGKMTPLAKARVGAINDGSAKAYDVIEIVDNLEQLCIALKKEQADGHRTTALFSDTQMAMLQNITDLKEELEAAKAEVETLTEQVSDGRLEIRALQQLGDEGPQ